MAFKDTSVKLANPAPTPVTTEPAVRTFTELMSQLDAALLDVTKGKADVEATTKAALSAKERLDAAIARTRDLQQEFRSKVDTVIGEPSSDRVRVS
jgi:hypothetical protein